MREVHLDADELGTRWIPLLDGVGVGESRLVGFRVLENLRLPLGDQRHRYEAYQPNHSLERGILENDGSGGDDVGVTDDQLRSRRRRSVVIALVGYALLLFVWLLPPDPSIPRSQHRALIISLSGCFALAGGIGGALQSSWSLWKRRR